MINPKLLIESRHQKDPDSCNWGCGNGASGLKRHTGHLASSSCVVDLRTNRPRRDRRLLALGNRRRALPELADPSQVVARHSCGTQSVLRARLCCLARSRRRVLKLTIITVQYLHMAVFL